MIKLRLMAEKAKDCEDFTSLEELENWFRCLERKPKDLKNMSMCRWCISNGFEWFSINTNMYDSPYENLHALILAWKNIKDSIKESGLALSH